MKMRCDLHMRENLHTHRITRTRRIRGEDGSALVELALTLPVFLALLTGICSFAIALSNQLTLIQATGTGGQYLAQLRSSSTNPCSDVFTAIKNAAPHLNSSNIGLTFTLNGTTVTGTSCSGYQTYLAEGAAVTVATTYPCNFSVYGIKFATTCQLAAQVTEYEY
jgi:Flp pilus assembly protein TadG